MFRNVFVLKQDYFKHFVKIRRLCDQRKRRANALFITPVPKVL